VKDALLLLIRLLLLILLQRRLIAPFRRSSSAKALVRARRFLPLSLWLKRAGKGRCGASDSREWARERDGNTREFAPSPFRRHRYSSPKRVRRRSEARERREEKGRKCSPKNSLPILPLLAIGLKRWPRVLAKSPEVPPSSSPFSPLSRSNRGPRRRSNRRREREEMGENDEDGNDEEGERGGRRRRQ
jgi:hypothetical protein